MEGILIPGLPNEVGLQILARIPRKYYPAAISNVSSSWREAATSPQLFALRKHLGVTESWFYTAVVYEHKKLSCILWFARNVNGEDLEWRPLPLMREEHRPIYGFGCTVIGELLFVIGGCEWKSNCTRRPATNKVSVYNARTNEWSCVQGMKDARAVFGCGVADGKLYVAGGHRFTYSNDGNSSSDESSDDEDDQTCKILKSAEMYNPLTDVWTPVADMIHAMHLVCASDVDNKFVFHGFFYGEDLHICETVEVFEAEENRWVEFHKDEKVNNQLFHLNEGRFGNFQISFDNSDFRRNITIGEDGEKCELDGTPQACVSVSI